jgi:dsDNA-binding SOS-regulon protein
MMQNCLGSQIGQNIQVYIDEVVITKRKEESLIYDLKKTFDNLDRYKLKLNPTKCSFGVSAGQLLGFLVLARGIEANPEKIQAILTMGKPPKLHEVQQLTGRVAALSRFVARLGEKALTFYTLMKKSDKKFEWIEEADAAFSQLKKVLSTPPVLVAQKEREPLLLYIATTHQAVSTVLVVEQSEDGKAHGV